METKTGMTGHSRKPLRCRSAVAAVLAIISGIAFACEPNVTIDDGGARLRPHTDDLIECTIDEVGYQKLMMNWPPNQAPVKWLFLGRLVDYPWLVDLVVKAALDDDDWNKQLGQPITGHDNSYFAALLESDAIRTRLEGPLRHHGLYIRSIAVEKVLKAPAKTVLDHLTADGIVPFDAQVWLNLGVLEK